MSSLKKTRVEVPIAILFLTAQFTVRNNQQPIPPVPRQELNYGADDADSDLSHNFDDSDVS